jgi:hypothetical protein
MALSDGMRGKQWRWIGVLVLLLLIGGLVVGIVRAEHAREARERRQQTAERVRAIAEVRQLHRHEVEEHHREAVAAARAGRAEAAAKQREREAEEPLERWHELSSALTGLLLLANVKTYLGIDERAETGHRSEAESQLRTLTHQISKERNLLQTLSERSSGSCASAIENARGLLGRWQNVVEQTAVDSRASEYAWANIAYELEQLMAPPARYRDGLQTCDPSGTGEVEPQTGSG